MTFKYFELMDGVFVFQDVLKNPDHTYEIIKKSKIKTDELFTPWVESEFPWYKTTMDMDDKRDLSSEAGQMLLEIKSIFFKCFKTYKENHLDLDYIKSLEIEPFLNLPITEQERSRAGGWGPADILIVDYANIKLDNGYINGYHIDRTPFWGASSHAFTLNIYPYDKFDGGGLYFIDMTTMEKKYTDKGIEYYLIDEPLYYEPKAGEAILFKSTHPHAVKEVTNGEKLFIRLFMEAPRPNQYTKDAEGMTQEEIDQKRLDSMNDCLKNNRQQCGIYPDLNAVNNTNDQSQKYVIRK